MNATELGAAPQSAEAASNRRTLLRRVPFIEKKV